MEEKNLENAVADAMEEAKDYLIIVLNNPVKFEGKKYDTIDLTGLRNINTGDMVKVSRILSRGGNIDVNQELTLEYAINIAAIATNMPVEFFEQLPPNLGMQVKGRVTSFLLRSE